MNSNQIRQKFLNYFKKNNHAIVPSASLIPENDPSLLFVNAGMVPFKHVFLQQEKRPYTRATSAQRCVRAGGKHNDLENVGYTARHHTFFEMLGNFSFGDYSKREAIAFAWHFLTKELKLPEEKLWVTVFKDDKEAENIWFNEMKINQQRFSRCGEKDNFWSMGDTGPCGPCTEIFYDHGPEIPGGPPGSPDEDGDRYIEIWNLVFMQYNRAATGEMTSLPKPCVDTGMGLERLAAVLQGVHSNYEIDIFQNIIKKIAHLADIQAQGQSSLRVIADHIRSSTFLIVDGITPSNEGRGYVLRRIIRRALRHGNKLGFNAPFFHKLVKPLVQEMGVAYPELAESVSFVEQVLKKEEEQFANTLSQGLQEFNRSITNLTGKTIPGDVVFRLYDTYGFPVDLTADMARERELTLDMAGFENAMAQQRNQSKQASQFSAAQGLNLQGNQQTQFLGYETLSKEITVNQLFLGDESVETLTTGQTGIVILPHTPFYAEAGGQVGDVGLLEWPEGQFAVSDTQKQNDIYIHYGQVIQGTLKATEKVHAKVDANTRLATVLNHSATHLLHAALRQVLGDHVQQKGSLVAPDRLRFDFTHFEPLTNEQVNQIEQLVNQQIRANLVIDTHIMTPEAAKTKGAMALFGEKYGDSVRVLAMGDFSMELCGGTHAKRTGDIGLFKITIETSVAAGIRRIEAVTGEKAIQHLQTTEQQINALSQQLKSQPEQLSDRVDQVLSKQRQLEKDIEQFKAKLAASKGSDLAGEAKELQGFKLLAAKLEDADRKALLSTLDQLKQKLKTAVIVLASVEAGRVNLIAGVTKDMTDKIKAGDLVKFIAEQVGGKGGGRPDMAQAGGDKPENLQSALDSVLEWVKNKLEKR